MQLPVNRQPARCTANNPMYGVVANTQKHGESWKHGGVQQTSTLFDVINMLLQLRVVYRKLPPAANRIEFSLATVTNLTLLDTP